ncbi:sensor domain-containing diguanylate cyclase [Aliagarivorans marinus]|uniref:sensor domain-containing diguanylate cyclase n=1 Tax=Aliagarivorans marinus TaxID=561965 RepID=UPI00040EC602|nr:sensor domain-containing diguanylate cyclase [Aliagarivorans marinus]
MGKYRNWPISRSFVVKLCLISVWLFVLIEYCVANRQQVLESFKVSSVEAAATIEDDFLMAQSYASSLSQQMSKNIQLAELQALYHPAASFLHYFPQYDNFGIDPEYSSRFNINGSLLGLGHYQRLDGQQFQELSAALALGIRPEPRLGLVWTYYTSLAKFSYIVPGVSVDQYQLTEDTFASDHWQLLLPENNPTANPVVSDAYQDAAGEGLVVSIASPVLVNDVFKGAMFVDVSQRAWAPEALWKGSIGEFILTSRQNQVLATSVVLSDEQLTSELDYRDFLSKWDTTWLGNEPLVLRYPLLDGQLQLIAYIYPSTLVWATLWDISYELVLMHLLLLSLYLLYRLRRSLVFQRYVAAHDSLSGLLNRGAMSARSEEMRMRHQRFDEPMSLVLFDLDHFKSVNDNYGHHTGDEVIQAFAKVLKNVSRNVDLVSRHGGEEFLAMLERTDINGAEAFANRVLKATRVAPVSGKRLTVTASAGATQLLVNEEIDSALKRADKALYQAKSAGRDRCISLLP